MFFMATCKFFSQGVVSCLLYFACTLLSMVPLFIFFNKVELHPHPCPPLFFSLVAKIYQVKTNVNKNNEDKKGKMISEFF